MLLVRAVLVVLWPIRATRILVAITLLASKPALVVFMEQTKISKQDPQALI
jgi:hypothetical protein